ncbi:MAG TPA: glycosyltransferase family 4 protein [bacterium]|nr:glycosyltransferase family 4 protein [bacterium]
MKRFLFVIQRYGLDVDGGAELYCRWLAEHCMLQSQITILTTTARDYISWDNHFEPGQSTINDIPVIRAPVLQSRNINEFNRFTEQILTGSPSEDSQHDWLRAQGPWSPGILEYIRDHHSEYDGLIFFTYLYAPSVLGARIAPRKSILIPTAHDEPVAHLSIFHRLYSEVAGLLFLTPAEQTFVESTYSVAGKPSRLLGTGVDLPESPLRPEDVREKYGINGDILLYIGRVETGKGCGELIRYFNDYRSLHPGTLTLVLAGRRHMPVPDDPAIVCPGYIPDDDLKPLIEASTVVMVPSPFESLSILLLQAFACRKPVIANGHSAVLAGHCRRSNGGLYYETRDEFIETLDLLLKRKELRVQLGQNGQAYVGREYTWASVVGKFHEFVESTLPASRV